MRHWIIIFLIFGYFLGGCSSDEATNSDSSKNDTTTDTIEILLVMKSLTNPFYIEMEKGVRKAAEEFGFTLHVRSGTNETSIEQQAVFIEEYMQKGIDAIIIAPADSINIIPVLKRAQLRDIEIVNIDNRIDPESLKKAGLDPIPFVSVDNLTSASLAAAHIAGKASKGDKAVILEGIRTAENALQRSKGAKRAFEQAGIDIVAIETANWKIDEAYAVFHQMYTQNPDIRLVFASNDMMAMGVLRYISENKIQNILVAGYDDIPDARRAISEGRLHATVNQQADKQGYFGARFAYEKTIGKTVPLEKMVDAKLITSN